MRKILAIVLTLALCLSVSLPLTAFAEGEPGGDPAVTDNTGQEGGNPEEPAFVYAVSPAFQQKLFTELNAANQLIRPDSMAKVDFAEDKDLKGLFVTGTPKDIMSGKITLADAYDFDEKPEGRNTAVMPVGRISLDGLSDKGIKVTVNIYLDNKETPCASMLLRKQMGKAGWTRKGDKTVDVLSQNITGKHKVSIGFDIQTEDLEKDTTILLRSLTFCENSIPVLYFNIDESEGSVDAMNASPDHSTECYGSATLQVPKGYKGNFSDKELKSIEDMELEYLRGRGNSTWDMDKKPYKVKFDKKQNLLGMGKSKHWVLLANRYDNTLLRNRMTYWLGRKLNEEFAEMEIGCEFTPACEPVEVVMNGEYYGSYLLSEQVRVEENRVEVEDLGKADMKEAVTEPLISGGYLLNMEGGDNGEIETEHGGVFGFESPDFSEYPKDEDGKNAMAAQKKYIAGFMEKIENALYGENLISKDGHSYEEYLDKQSAVDYWWVQEFSINGDAFMGGSNYLYKRRDKTDEAGNTTTSKVHWGPLWDFDYVAWGNPNYDAESVSNFDNTSNGWMKALRADTAYAADLMARWDSLLDKENKYKAHLNDLFGEITKKGGVLDQYYDETRVSQLYDYYKWGFFNAFSDDYYRGTGVSGAQDGGQDGGQVQDGGQDGDQKQDGAQEQNPDGTQDGDQDEQESPKPQTYESELEQLRGWIERRRAWVNDNITHVGIEPYIIRFLVDGKVIETRQYTEDEEFGTLPTPPAKKGKTFIGWKNSYGAYVDAADYVCESADLKAYYMDTNKVPKAKNIYFKDYSAHTWLDTSSDEDDLYTPDYKIMPEGAIATNIKWSVSDTSIAEVDKNGTVNPKKSGIVKVKATLESGASNSYTLYIIRDDEELYDINSIKLNKTSISLKTGGYTQIKADFSPKPHFSGEMNWFTLDPKIISVDSYGIVKGLRPGKTTVVLLDTDSKKYKTCKVTVTATTAYKIKVAKAKTVKGVKAAVVKKGSARSVKVSWKKRSGVSGYYILRATKKNGKYKRVGAVKKAGTKSWTDRKVTKGKKYFYKVRTYTKIGKKRYAGKLSTAVKVTVK